MNTAIYFRSAESEERREHDVKCAFYLLNLESQSATWKSLPTEPMKAVRLFINKRCALIEFADSSAVAGAIQHESARFQVERLQSCRWSLPWICSFRHILMASNRGVKSRGRHLSKLCFLWHRRRPILHATENTSKLQSWILLAFAVWGRSSRWTCGSQTYDLATVQCTSTKRS